MRATRDRCVCVAQLYAVLRDAINPEDALQGAKKLITAGKSGHALGNHGRTSALHLAIARHKSLELVTQLVEAGAELTFDSQVFLIAAKHPRICLRGVLSCDANESLLKSPPPPRAGPGDCS